MKLFLFFCLSVLSITVMARDWDHSKVVSPDKCIECHKQAGQSWEKTHHAMVFNKFHRSKDAKAIAKAMGIKRIKKDSTCMQCHYTVGAEKKPIAGVSCESCHGPGKDWVKIHNDYGGKDIKKADESPSHKAKRIASAERNGMIHPSNIYNVAQNCFQCHTVPNEELVEVGGHKAGSDFELVSWSQGEVLHNYNTGNGKNVESSAERKRVMYVIGRVLDLEYGLRGVAEITKVTGYAAKMAKRVKRALGYIKQINETAKIPELDEIYNIGKSVKLSANNKKAALDAANKISSIAKKLAVSDAVLSKSMIDALIPSERKGSPLN